MQSLIIRRSTYLKQVQLWSKKSEELAKVLPKDILPSEFGGHERSLEELKSKVLLIHIFTGIESHLS